MWPFDSMGIMMPVGSDLVLQVASIYECDGHIVTIRKIGVQQQVGVVEHLLWRYL